MKTVKEVEDWLYSQPRGQKRKDFTTMIHAVNSLDIDVNAMNIIHVTGTNGKGSTVTYIANVLYTHNKNVACYTSPHIRVINERFSYNNQMISDEELVYLANIVKEKITGLSQFELMTVLFFLFVKQHHVDYVLLEVGIGGLHDSTNFIMPKISVITSVGLDHTEILGDTLEAVAFQKAGIIKQERPVFVGRIAKEPLVVIKAVAYEKNAPFFETVDRFKSTATQLIVFNEPIDIPIVGSYQKDNLSLAIAVCQYLLSDEFSLSLLKSGLKQVYWPGRFESVVDTPKIIVDGAHNVHGVTGLLETLQSELFNNKRISILFAALPNKDYHGMLNLLHPIFKVYLTRFDAITAQKEISYEGVPEGIEWIDNYEVFIREYVNNPSADVLIVTGSLYFVSEFKNFVETKGKSFIL